MNGSESSKESSIPKAIEIRMFRSPHFRFVFGQNFWINSDPYGNLRLAFFADRFPVPSRISHEVNADHSIGKEIKEERVVEKGIDRELEFELILPISTAKSMYEELGKYISSMEQTRESSGK